VNFAKMQSDCFQLEVFCHKRWLGDHGWASCHNSLLCSSLTSVKNNVCRKWRQTPPEGYVHGGNEDDMYDPVSAGKASLMTSVRGAGAHHQQQQFTATTSPHHFIHSGAPPAYGVNVGMVDPRGGYPSFQQYCSGDVHHHHSPNCYGTIDAGDVEQTMTGLTLTVPDGVDCGLHGGCRRLDHVYESASFGGGRNIGGRHLGPRLVGLVDEQFMTSSGTVVGVGGGNVGGELTGTTVVCPLHFDIGNDGGKAVA
jgi:hypothetical protein